MFFLISRVTQVDPQHNRYINLSGSCPASNAEKIMIFSLPSLELPGIVLVAAVAFLLGTAVGAYAVTTLKQRQRK